MFDVDYDSLTIVNLQRTNPHAVEEEEEDTPRRLAETQVRQRRISLRIVLNAVTARVRIDHGVRHV